MSKPINIEAQRIYKILQETFEKLKVLSLLNNEFFDEVYNREEDQLASSLGPELASLLKFHATQERLFKENNIGQGDNKMLSDTDELMTDSKRLTADELRKSTTNLVRHFKSEHMQLKLKQVADVRSNEYAGLTDTFNSLKTLIWQKLTTSQEEEQSVREQLNLLKGRTSKLQAIRDEKKEQLQKYEEETKEQKEQREYEIQNLKKTIADENANKEGNLKRLNEDFSNQSERFEKHHIATVKQMKEDIDKLEKKLEEVKKSNKIEEQKLRGEYKKADTSYQEMINAYDQELGEVTREKQKAFEQYQETHHDLEQVRVDYQQRLEERKKREEILEIMKKKNDEQQKQIDLLNRASEWVQAHWKGLLARREMEKARKGRKKKKKKK